MMYVFEQRIYTLAKNAVVSNKQPASFSVEKVSFVQWPQNFWLAKAEISAENYQQAFVSFRLILRRIIPRISLIAQCYIESVFQPYLIVKQGAEAAFFRHTKEVAPVGLMFMDEQFRALQVLSQKIEIPDEFYFYWNDVVNATGYTPKLVLMFSALEALAKDRSGGKDWEKLREILGADLLGELYAPRTGLRHRLSHGEYFNDADPEKNYILLVHSRIVAYFNKSIIEDRLLDENVVNPQRHFFGNKEEVRIFVKPRSPEAKLVLKDVLIDFEENGINRLSNYDVVLDQALQSSY